MIFPDSFERKIGFDQVRLRIKELCSSSLGRNYVDEMVFSVDYQTIDIALNQTNEMLQICGAGKELPLSHLYDVIPALNHCKIKGVTMTVDTLSQLGKSLKTIGLIYEFLNNSEENRVAYPYLVSLTSKMMLFPIIIKEILRIVDEYGNVRDSASDDLRQIRSEQRRVASSINSILRRVVASAVENGFVDKDATPTVRDGRLVIPVVPMNKRKISGIVHDESATGKTVFIEPAEVVEANNRVRELEMDERREILRILSEFTERIRNHIPDICESLNVAGYFDFINAKAKYASETEAILPHYSDKPEFEIYHAVHPILLDSLKKQGRDIVPLNILLSPEKRILVISGPNAGGKSVCLKTAGIVQYMFQCGILPTVFENSHLGIFNHILLDIGDDQSIENDLSTYSSHLRNMKMFVSSHIGTSLVLIDEFGGGTEPQIGGALAQAILHKLNEQGAWGIITTHYQNLKQYAEVTDGLVNGSMLYDRQLMKPLFQLSIGVAGSSFALEIARKTGLPKDIIDEASDLVGSEYLNMDRYLNDIARDRKYWENKRMSIRQKEKKIDQVLERYEADAELLRAKRREIISDAQNEARKIIEGSNAAVERTIREIKESQAQRERTLQARQKLVQKRKQIEEDLSIDEPSILSKAPKPKTKKVSKKTSTVEQTLNVGDYVQLDRHGSPGKILEIKGNSATVVFGMLKTSVNLNRLTLSTTPPRSIKDEVSFISDETSNRLRNRQLQFKREIDLRGMRLDEAIQAVTYFIDDAIQFCQNEVRILHGTGTGALREGIRQYLDTVSGVASYRDEHVQFGGAGITVVTLH